jgi:Ala-tRNA(Pro) deacylase
MSNALQDVWHHHFFRDDNVDLGRKIQRKTLFLISFFNYIAFPMTLFETISSFLRDRNISFRTVHHQPTFTSEESAKARGEEVRTGGKAIVLKIDDAFKLFVLSAALKIDSKKLKEYFHAKSIRFATKEELHSLAGLAPGSVPPFGRPILDFDLYIDSSILQNENIAFNAGSLTDSIIMTTTDYLAIANGNHISFSQQ